MINRVVKPTAVRPTAGVKAVHKVPVAGIVGVVVPLVAVAPAYADEVDSTIDTVVSAIQTAGDFAKSAGTTISTGFDAVKAGYESVSPFINQTIEAATPYAKQAVTAVSAAANSVAPIISDAVKSSGLPVKETLDTVNTTAGTVSTTAAPYVTKVSEFVTTTDPIVLGEIGVGAAALLLLVPGFLDGLKGYAGKYTAAAAQDNIVNAGAFLIDVRSAREKDASGLPDLPSSANSKYFEVELATTADRKLRGSLRDAGSLEVQITALQIASLKKLSKGSIVIIMDKNGGTATNVAKALASKGFGKVYTMTGGFDGWTSSKLQIKPAASASGFSGTSIGTVFSKKALPSGR
eukprot:gene25113-10754_t